jgi:SAM-dependent methyltransferase
VVANNSMNRERGLRSYLEELRPAKLWRTQQQFLEFLGPQGAWLDLCCGQARALNDAAALAPELHLEGVDLVDYFHPNLNARVQRRVESLRTYTPTRKFRLITCIHGLHYLGDKLDLLQRASTWLKPDGILLAQLDCNNLWLDQKPIKPKFLRDHGLTYHTRARLLACTKPLIFQVRYQGADDQAGPNYTGQPAVNSHYRT